MFGAEEITKGDIVLYLKSRMSPFASPVPFVPDTFCDSDTKTGEEVACLRSSRIETPRLLRIGAEGVP